MSKRMIIYPKDVARITGKSVRHARTLLSRIKKTLDKSRYHPVTVVEFAKFMNMSPEEVYASIDP
jgi:hypothetical protein